MRDWLLPLGIVFATLAPVSLARAETIKTMRIGNWEAGAYTNDQTGAFSHCAASSNYRSGISMAFAINKNFGWSIGFANPNWQLDKGATYPISFRVDGSAPIEGTATSVNKTLVEVQLADSTALFGRFKYGNMLVVYTAGQTMNFMLTDTSRVLPSLLQCVNRFKNEAPNSAANSNKNPFASAAPVPTQAPTSPDDGDRRAEATSILATILARSGVRSFQMLSPDEIKTLKSDAAWRSAEGFGTMSIVGGQKPEDMNASIIASDAKSCHDKFFSGSMPDAAGSRLFTSCKSDKQTITVFYSAIQRAKGGYYLLATGGIQTTAEADGKPTQDLDTGIRSVAYKVITPN